MEHHQLRSPAEQLLVERKTGPPTVFNAGDALAAVIEMYPGALTAGQRGRLGRSAKELLEGGYQPNVVCAALLAAIRLARIGLAESFALEIQNAKLGQAISWRDYREALHELVAEGRIAANPELRALDEQMRSHFRERA